MIAALIGGIFSIGNKLIVDEDKKIEYAYKTQEILFNLLGKLITAQTIPWVDAIVKLMVACIALARPIGTFALTCFGLYCDIMDLSLSETTLTALESAFPAWGVARQYDKSKKKKEKIEDYNDW